MYQLSSVKCQVQRCKKVIRFGGFLKVMTIAIQNYPCKHGQLKTLKETYLDIKAMLADL